MSRKIILFIAAIISIIVGYIYYTNSPSNNPNYIKTQALVTKINSTKKDYKNITITYCIDHIIYSKDITVSKGLFSPQKNSNISIYYNKDKPSEILHNDRKPVSYALISIGIILIAILIIDKFSVLINKLPFTRTN